MRDELDRMISSYFEAQVKSIPQRPFPSFSSETARNGEAPVAPLRRKTGRHPAIAKPAALTLKLAGAAAIAAICVFLAPRDNTGQVARGVEVLMEHSEFRTALRSAAVEITLETGKSLSKE